MTTVNLLLPPHTNYLIRFTEKWKFLNRGLLHRIATFQSTVRNAELRFKGWVHMLCVDGINFMNS